MPKRPLVFQAPPPKPGTDTIPVRLDRDVLDACNDIARRCRHHGSVQKRGRVDSEPFKSRLYLRGVSRYLL